ncbi:glutaredoxin family protein [Candidatus Hodarchaeum mangrovi]
MLINLEGFSGEIHQVEGTREKQHEIFLFAISTCSWCRQAFRWLNDNKFKYSYLFIDDLPLKERQLLKEQIETIYKLPPTFPFLIVDRFHGHAGFNPQEWEIILS